MINDLSVDLKERMSALNFRLVRFRTLAKPLDLKKLLMPTFNLDKLTRIVAEA